MASELDDAIHDMRTGTHAVLVYDTLAHKREILLKHLKEGVGQEGLVYAYAGEEPVEFKREMSSRGIDSDDLTQKGLLTITPSTDMYLKDGVVDIQSTIAGFADLAWGYKKKGLKGIRAGADLSPLARKNTIRDLQDYEEALGRTFKFPGKGICAYNLVDLYNTGQLNALLPIFMAHGLVILSGPGGYAIRQPEEIRKEGLGGVLHHVLPGEPKPPSGFRPVSSP